jgi:Rrf2 family protein
MLRVITPIGSQVESLMFSETVEYALRAVVYLAAQSIGPCTTHGIARETQVPPAYLSKVLQRLVHAGILRSQRGIGGGVALRKPPHEVTILEIVQTMDPIRRITTCPLGLASHEAQLCPLHERMDQAMAAMEATFAATTVADMVNNSYNPAALCAFPLLLLPPATS